MNKERLKAVIDFIEYDPKQWNQDKWLSDDIMLMPDEDGFGCSTAMCIAGWGTKAAQAADPTITCHLPVTAKFVAEKWFGLTTEQADYLFAGYRTWDEVKEFYATEGASGS